MTSQTSPSTPLIDFESSSHKAFYSEGKSSRFPFTYQELKEAMALLLKNGTPTSISYLSLSAAGLVSLRFAGKYGNPNELAGVALGFTWSTMFGLSIMTSINQGFSVLASQLYGAKKFKELGILLQKNLFILTLTLIPLLLTFCFADTALLKLGMDYEISMNTGLYLRHAIPSLIGLTYFECLKFFLISQNFFYVQSIIQGSLSIVHVLWCYIFVVLFDMPVVGVAIAKSITDVTCGVALYLYVKYTNACQESWLPWDRRCLDGWFSYLKHTLILGANYYIEFASYEGSLFICSILHDKYALGAHGIAITLINAVYMLALGNSYAMQTYIGNAAGEGDTNKAKKFFFAGLSINSIISFVNIVWMMVWSGSIAGFFTDDDQTKDCLQTIIIMYAASLIIDTSLGHLSGTLKTLGGERGVITFFCITYIGIGINFQWIVGVFLGYGYKAIWAGFILGMCLMFTYTAIQTIRLDWEKEIANIQKRIEGERIEEDKGKYIEMEEI